MPELNYDVIVIGSGPAGATAAFTLARAGIRTLILEKEKLPRYKPCGGGLTNKVPPLMDLDMAAIAEDSISRMALAYRHTIKVDLHWAQPTAWCVMRDKFDALLTDRAVQAGAALHDGEPVQSLALDEGAPRVRTARGEYCAAMVIGADGANGITAKSSGLSRTRDLAAALEIEMEVAPAQLDAWRHTFYVDFAPIPYGYAWIFPKADHLSVGIGQLISGELFHYQRANKGQRPDLRALLATWIAGEPTLQGGKPRLTRGHLLPLGGRAARLHNGRVAIAGDAGGMIDPFTGEGIYFAMRSGQIAAETMIEAFRSQDLSLETYTPRIHQEILTQFRASSALTPLFYRMPRFWLRAVGRSKTLQGHITGAVDNTRGYAGFLWKLARKLGQIADRVG